MRLRESVACMREAKEGRVAKKAKKKRAPRAQFTTDKVDVLGGAAQILRTAINGDVWQFRTWLPSEGKYLRLSLKTKDKEVAIQKAQDKWIEVQSLAQKGKTVFSPTLEKIVELYLEDRQGDVDSGRITKGRHGTLTSHLKAGLRYLHSAGYTRGGELDSRSLMGYEDWRRKDHPEIKRVTIANELATIRHCLKYAHIEQLTDVAAFTTKKIKVDEQVDVREVEARTFSNDEYERLTRYLRSWAAKKNCVDENEYVLRQALRHWVLVGANTMMRVGELRQLTWGNVKTYKHKDYTLAQIYVARDTTKVRKPRQVDVRGGQYLERWKKTSKNTKNTDLVFSDAGGKQIDKTYQYRAWKQWMDELGYDEDGSRNLTWYSLRHYGITMRIAAGNTYETIAMIAGTSAKEIEKTYRHILREEMRTAATREVEVLREIKEG